MAADGTAHVDIKPYHKSAWTIGGIFIVGSIAVFTAFVRGSLQPTTGPVVVTVDGIRGAIVEGQAVNTVIDVTLTASGGATAWLAAALVASGFVVALGGLALAAIESMREYRVTPIAAEGEEPAIDAAAFGEAMVTAALNALGSLAKAKAATAAVIAGILLSAAGAGIAWQTTEVAKAAIESPGFGSPEVVVDQPADGDEAATQSGDGS